MNSKPTSPGKQIIEDPGNYVFQRQLQWGIKLCIPRNYPHPITSISHQYIRVISRYDNRDHQQSKLLFRNHPGQCNTQGIQCHNPKWNGSTAENCGNTSTTGLHHGHEQQQQQQQHQWQWRQTKHIRPSPITSPQNTVCHMDGAITVVKNAPEIVLDTLMQQQKVSLRSEIHRAYYMKRQVIIQWVIEQN